MTQAAAFTGDSRLDRGGQSRCPPKRVKTTRTCRPYHRGAGSELAKTRAPTAAKAPAPDS